MKNRKSKKKKKNLAIYILIIFIFLGIFYYFNMNKPLEETNKNINLKDITIEYGNKIDYKEIYNKVFKKEKINDLVNIYIDNNIVKTNDKYLFNQIGKHELKLEFNSKCKYCISRKKSTYEFININVIDTKAPILEGIKNKTIHVGDKINLKDGIKAYDVVDGTLEFIIKGKVNINKKGLYNIEVSTRDKNNNETKKTFTVTVKEKQSQKIIQEKSKTSKGYSIQKKDGVYYINNILIANKTYSLPKSYAPGGLLKIFNENFNKMKNDAKKENIVLKVISGYRSYGDQNIIYNNYVKKDGKTKADTYSARPGHSEHQTGLAADINSLKQSFINTSEGKWLNDNCYKYGFIIRYPKGKEKITGYMYEPWHIRYVGIDIAKKLYNNGNWITLEEYLGIDSVYK